MSLYIKTNHHLGDILHLFTGSLADIMLQLETDTFFNIHQFYLPSGMNVLNAYYMSILPFVVLLIYLWKMTH